MVATVVRVALELVVLFVALPALAGLIFCVYGLTSDERTHRVVGWIDGARARVLRRRNDCGPPS